LHEFDGDAKNCQCISQGQGLDLIRGQGYQIKIWLRSQGVASRTTSLHGVQL